MSAEPADVQVPVVVQRWRRYANELQPVLPVLLPWAEALGYEV